MKRHQFKNPGRDCINHPCGKYGCGTNPGSNHGVGSETWSYAVITDEGDVATSITVRTRIFPESVDAWRCGTSLPYGSDLSTHTNFPIDRETVRRGGRGQDCTWVKGELCFEFATSSLDAEKFATAHVDFDHYEQPDAFWKALEELAETRVANARAANASATYERCVHCDGLGTVKKA